MVNIRALGGTSRMHILTTLRCWFTSVSVERILGLDGLLMIYYPSALFSPVLSGAVLTQVVVLVASLGNVSRQSSGKVVHELDLEA
jgi:glucokinase